MYQYRHPGDGIRAGAQLRVPRYLVAHAPIPTISFDFRDTILEAISLWSENGPLSLPDAYHLVFTKQQGLTRIYTFDRKMNRYAGVERVEPQCRPPARMMYDAECAPDYGCPFRRSRVSATLTEETPPWTPSST